MWAVDFRLLILQGIAAGSVSIGRPLDKHQISKDSKICILIFFFKLQDVVCLWKFRLACLDDRFGQYEYSDCMTDCPFGHGRRVIGNFDNSWHYACFHRIRSSDYEPSLTLWLASDDSHWDSRFETPNLRVNAWKARFPLLIPELE